MWSAPQFEFRNVVCGWGVTAGLCLAGVLLVFLYVIYIAVLGVKSVIEEKLVDEVKVRLSRYSLLI